MKTLLIAAISYIAVGLLIEAPAVAEKPDGQKPASEGACDSRQGPKLGLYESLVNPNEKMRDSDSAMPCAKAPSPSRDESTFDSRLPKPAQILTV